ncbi:MAG: hypothetical protein AAF957_22560 [Planctomycetota bacterium]
MRLHHALLALPLAVACAAPPPANTGFTPPPPSSPPFEVPTDVTVPAGTPMMVRMHDSVNTRQHKAGHRFYMILEGDLVSGGQTVAPRGSVIYGSITGANSSGRVVGRSSLVLTPTHLLIGSRLVPITTSQIQAVGAQSATGNTARRTARAAAIGGLANGSSGARTGAKVGVGASLLTDDGQIQVPSGTLLEFQLAGDLTL